MPVGSIDIFRDREWLGDVMSVSFPPYIIMSWQLQHVLVQTLRIVGRSWDTQGRVSIPCLCHAGPGLHFGIATLGLISSDVMGQGGGRSPANLDFSLRGDSAGCVHQSCYLVTITTWHILCSPGTPCLVCNAQQCSNKIHFYFTLGLSIVWDREGAQALVFLTCFASLS